MPISKYALLDASFGAKLRTTPSPLSLRKGEWQALYDVRTADKTIRARFGTSTIGAIVSAASFRGAYFCTFRTIPTVFVATYVTGATDPADNRVRIYASTDGATWAEITKQFTGVGSGGVATSIGPYSETRLVDDGMVWFALMTDRDIKVLSYPSGSYSQDCLVFGNQSSYPRVYSPFYGGNTAAVTNGSGSLQTAIVEPIDPPLASRTAGIRAKMTTTVFGFAIRDSGNTSYANSGANFVLADSGASATDNYPVLTVGVSSAANDTAILDMATGAAILQGKQLHIGIDTTWAAFLQSVKIEVGNYSGSFTAGATIWDGSSNARPFPVISVLDTNKKLYSFDVEQFNTATTYDAIRITFLGPVVSATKTVNIFYITPGVAVATAMPGQTNFALTWYNAGSHTESPPVVLQSPTYPLSLEAPGGNEVPDSYSTLAPPSSASIYFAYNLPLLNPTQAQIDKGVEAMRIYRKRPEDGDYFLVESFELATYSETPGTPPTAPVWAFTGSTAASAIRYEFALSREPLSYTVPPPDLHKSMPKCRAACSANGRAHCGPRVTGKPNYMYSEFGQPFRFLEDDLIDFTTGEFLPLAAGCLNMQGDQINAFAVVSNGLIGIPDALGVSTVYVFGENEVYATSGKTANDIRRLSSIGIPGTISPGSVSVGIGCVFFVDKYMMPWKIKGGSGKAIGHQTVENLTKGVPTAYRRYIWGTHHDQKYYLNYVPSGATTPTRVLVWDDYIEDWVSVDRPPWAFEGSVSFQDLPTESMKLMAFMQQVGQNTTLVAYDYDGSATTDLGSAIEIEGTSYELHDELWTWIEARRIGWVSDQVTAGTITWSLAWKPGGGTRTKTVSLAHASASFVRRFDSTPAYTGEQGGGSCTVSFSASVPGGTRIYEAHIEIEPTQKEFQVA